MPPKNSSAIFLLCSALGLSGGRANPPIDLMPMPAQVDLGSGQLDVRNGFHWLLESAADPRIGRALVRHFGADKADEVPLRIAVGGDAADESYTLKIDRDVGISA